MKIKDGYTLHSVAGETVVIPCGGINFDKMITLNETAAFIWKRLQQECSTDELVEAILSEYEVDKERAEECVGEFIVKLKESDFLE